MLNSVLPYRQCVTEQSRGRQAGQVMGWSVYMILCSDGSLYTGITTDVDRRFRQHASQKGAKYFRHCEPRRIVFVEKSHSRGSASRREAAIKKMKREGKLQLIAGYPAGFDN